MSYSVIDGLVYLFYFMQFHLFVHKQMELQLCSKRSSYNIGHAV